MSFLFNFDKSRKAIPFPLFYLLSNFKFGLKYMISIQNRAVKHHTLHVLHKCENLICVEVGLLRLQRLMEKPATSLC
ncbi:Tfiih basal transcription factor complex p44 subunit [Daphnia magna]|uniref:Tfiih basal transcription factor complex p44 subunit n=1 Tax=Daphnia magna TaxID=35525 RepID=A0A164RB88_9CRUS|nr:Tfiih basal transcription factor complex p44 subunit [Daphnia magna]